MKARSEGLGVVLTKIIGFPRKVYCEGVAIGEISLKLGTMEDCMDSIMLFSEHFLFGQLLRTCASAFVLSLQRGHV